MRNHTEIPIPYAKISLLYFASRSLIVVVGWVSGLILEPGMFASESETLKGMFLHWDTGWYLKIIQNGYSFIPDQQSSVNFFPGYPIPARWLYLAGIPAGFAGFTVSNLACLISCYFL